MSNLVDPTKFTRLKKYSILAYSPGKPDAATLIVWGSFDTLLEAVNKYNNLTEHERTLAYILKNVTWKTEVTEVDDV